MTQFGITAVPHGNNSITTSNGYGVFPMLSGSYPSYSGNFSYNNFTDAKSITWSPQDGGYSWPSVGWGTNVTNSPATYFFFSVHDGDSDIGINGERRAEISSTNVSLTPGQSLSYFVQTRHVAYTATQYQGGGTNGAWCFEEQFHYNNGPSIPDIFSVQCSGGQLQFTYHNGSACGSPITITVGQVIDFQVDLFWSAGHTTDTLVVYEGVDGGALSQLCSLGPAALFSSTETSAYMKEGIYTGDIGQQAGIVSLEVMNAVASNTAGAYDSYRTTQPALPTHP
jgi:hypothetical protein